MCHLTSPCLPCPTPHGSHNTDAIRPDEKDETCLAEGPHCLAVKTAPLLSPVGQETVQARQLRLCSGGSQTRKPQLSRTTETSANGNDRTGRAEEAWRFCRCWEDGAGRHDGAGAAPRAGRPLVGGSSSEGRGTGAENDSRAEG